MKEDRLVKEIYEARTLRKDKVGTPRIRSEKRTRKAVAKR